MKIKTLLTCIAISSMANIINAQITASATQGCAPMTVTFTVATPSTTGTYYWNFKNGGFAATVPSDPPVPSTFNTPNTYVVEVSETNGGAAKYTLAIDVFVKPILALTATPSKGCVPLNVSLNITPTLPAGVVVNNYTWDFGDGAGTPTGTASEPHVYSSPGVFDVSVGLETNFPSCNYTPSFPEAVSCSALPLADFTPSPSSGCVAPLTVSFTNNSSSPSGALPLTYEWNLGSGIINTTIPSPKTYLATGNYSVSLTATDTNNCKGNTNVQTISIGTPVSDFTLPDTVCVNIANSFTNTSTAGFSNWVFDASASPASSGATDPTVSFSTQGIHTVKLTTTSFSGACSNTKTKTVFVEAPIATFAATPAYSCNNTQTVNFAGSSSNTNIASWNWVFDDGSLNQTGKNINHTFSLPNANLDWQGEFWKKGRMVFTTTLTATTKAGCTSPPFSVSDTLDKPCAFFDKDKKDGCIPLAVTFTDQSWTDETITQWEWDFGDGSPIVTGGGSHLHTFVNDGKYTVSLKITNNRGCTDIRYDTIWAGKILPISATANPTSFCPLVPVLFTNTTVDKSLFDQWEWRGDNGFFDYITTDSNDVTALWRFRHSIGNQPVVLTGTYNGCKSYDTVWVFVKGPIAIFDYNQDCSARFDVVFTDKSLWADSLSWNFGDGSPLSDTTGTFTHTYPRGVYTVTLTATNDTSGCPDFDTTATFHIYDIKANFTASDTNLCKGQTYSFNAAASQDNAPSSISIPGPSGYGGYFWIYSDPTKKWDTVNSHQPVLNTTFNTPGNQTVSLVVRDPLGCPDTLTKGIKVYDIKAQYAVSDNAICFPAPAEIFTDQSTSPDTIITNWKWVFGDGTPNSLVQNPPPHTYTAGVTPNFITKLVVTNKLGCKDSITNTIITYTPTSTASAVNPNTCAGMPVTFSGTDFISQGSSLQFNWVFDDGSTPVLNANNVPHTYTTSGTYTTTLNFTENGSGCPGSTTTIVHVQNYPTPLFEAKNKGVGLQNNDIVCFDNPQVFFTDNSTVDNYSLPLTALWDLGSGSFTISGPTTLRTFSKGKKVVKLKSSTSYGCSSIDSLTLNVVGPEGDFSLSKTSICKGDSVTFTLINPIDVGSYFFDFADGTNSVPNTSPVTHTYTVLPPGGSYNVKINLSGINGVCPIAPDHTLNIYDVKSNFSVNSGLNTAVCLGQADTLVNLSSSFANTFVWDFGDGTPTVSTASKSPIYHTYAAPNNYNIKLTASNATYGCPDDTTETVSVHPLPVVSAIGDKVCKGNPAHLLVTNYNPAYTYFWAPNNELNSATVYNPLIAKSTFSNIYIVAATDINSCVNRASAFVEVIQPLEPIDFDTTIVVGDTIRLPITFQNNQETFTWTPKKGLSCLTCADPKVHPLEDITYNVLMQDSCTQAEGRFAIHVRPEMFIALPTTFTPNGDSQNDIIYVKGWGLKGLETFEIYNRWGELVFRTTDINEGWDGYYKGMLQNNDTYVYKVKAITWRDTEVFKEGHFNLMR